MIKKTIILSSISAVFLGRVYMRLDHAGAVETHILDIFQLTIFRPKKKQEGEMRGGPRSRPSVAPPGEGGNWGSSGRHLGDLGSPGAHKDDLRGLRLKN